MPENRSMFGLKKMKIIQDIQEGKFVSVKQFVPDAIIDARYAGCNNFTGTPAAGYCTPQLLLTVEAANALSKAADILRDKKYRIIVYDAYRPCKAVEYFMQWTADPVWCGNADYFPGLSKTQILTEGYIAAESSHSRGSTVDLGLCDFDGNELDMGGFFDFFNPISHHTAKVMPAAAARRRILLDAMTYAGFEAYQKEWWHYRLKNEPYPDTYWDFDITNDMF